MSYNEKSRRSTRRSLTTLTHAIAAVLLFMAGLLGISQPASAADGEFVNLSTRGWVGTGNDVGIVGFIIEDGSREVLIQALGPELVNRGISNALADPVLTVTNTTDRANPMELMVNDNWEDSQGQLVSDLWGGSPPLSAGSLSSAVVLTLEPGNYTAKVEGKNGTVGVAIVEVFAVDSDDTGIGHAPVDQAAFDTLFVGKQFGDSINGLIFLSPGRIREFEGGIANEGNYEYENTGANTGTLTYTYDVTDNDPAAEKNVVEMTFTSQLAGTFVATYTITGSSPRVTRAPFELTNRADTMPRFATDSNPGNQSYTVDTTINTLTLPEASSGDGPLTYTLSPSVPGLSFNPTMRHLTGTPTTIGTYDMTYTVTDADGDTDTLSFTITVENPRGNIVGNFHLHERHFNSRGIAYANDRFYFFNWLSNKVYAYSGTGQLDPDNDFDLTLATGPLHRFAYANNRFYVFHVHGTGGKLFAFTITGERDVSTDLELHPDNASPQGVAYADGRFYVVDQQDDKVYAYTDSGDRDAAADFALAHVRFFGSYAGIAYVKDRFYVLDDLDDKVYAYTISGDRDAAADFALACDNISPVGIAYANDSFHVLNWIDRKIYTYAGAGGNTNLSVCFRAGSNPGDRSYPIGTAISALTLPTARGGNGPLTYSLLPEVPGLSFDPATRRLTGTPSRVGTYDLTYRAMDVDGANDSLAYTITVTEPEPDLVVESATVSDDTPDAGASFTLSATVRNAGGGDATATTLRYYRSSDSRISSADTEVGTDAVGALSSSGTSMESISLTAPSSPGTYYYGACVDSVSGESNTANNCSSAVSVTVGDGMETSYTVLDRWWLYSNGLVNFVAVTIGPGDCVNVNGSTLNGVTYTVHSTKWQRRDSAASSWEDVPDTEQQGKVCSYRPTTPGEYRMVGDITRGGTRGNFSSDILTVN